MDTKWKRLYNKEDKRYGISQSDMYQMFAYSKKYDTKEIWLLYPKNEEMDNDKLIQFNSISPISNEIETEVRLFFVDVANIEENMEDLKEAVLGLCKLKNNLIP